MSKLRQKSDFNIDAAEKLIQLSIYAPSVHCSYYSCFQLLKYTVSDFCGMKYETQAINTSAGNTHTHQFLINYIVAEIKKNAGVTESQRFIRNYKDLQQFRIESDYENVEIDSAKGNRAFDKAKEIRNFLMTNFHV